jgi:hypothetical protein
VDRSIYAAQKTSCRSLATRLHLRTGELPRSSGSAAEVMVLTGLEAMPGQRAKVRTTKETEMKGLTGMGFSAVAAVHEEVKR